MESITKVWFSDGRIWIRTGGGVEYSQPLEAFPILKDATEKQREDFYLWDDNRSIRWDEIDEDIHISNFYKPESVNYDNEVNSLLSPFPWLDLREFAGMLGMSKSKLDRFRYGIWTPSAETLKNIKSTLRSIAKIMSAAVL